MSKSLIEIVVGVALALVIVLGASRASQPAGAWSDELAACGKCGDGFCNPRCGETAESCPVDCGGSPSVVAEACGKCGDGYCNPRCGETPDSCPRDCGWSTVTEASP